MKIGVFDSGYGGLTILDNIRQQLPQYDYLYLGDNARAPYGTRSYEVIYEYTLQAVRWLESQDCRLIILACNTASAKALRTIQQHDINPDTLRVLGVIRPTVEAIGPNVKHIGVLATPGTVSSGSYVIELEKRLASTETIGTLSAERSVFCQQSGLTISQQACPMWVPLIEAGEHNSDGADYFVEKYLRELLDQDPQIDTIILGCTHYPLLLPKIQACLTRLSHKADIICQGSIVASSLKDYLNRHTDIESVLSRGGTCRYITTESADKFRDNASVFLRNPIEVQHIELE